MPIFQDSNGMAVKFFIQKDIAQQIQAEVCETIAALGGRVEAKVPRAGYILVHPGTEEAERLRLCWSQPDRPERFFVPYTYVEACKIAGMLLKQIFVHEGQPIRMHIDSSIANVNVRATLAARIMHSGGDPTASAQSARVILADPNTEVFHHLVKTYQGEPDKYVESYLWVKKCIEKGQVIYTPVIYKNPGGRRPGEERTQFTEEDEMNLCDWIAQKIPYKETGGRTGNRLYIQLCEMSSDPEYAWATRHTWQSWRERYKKNAGRLDVRISEIVELRKPAHGEKGQYGYVRQPEEKPKRTRNKKRRGASDAATQEHGAQEPAAGPSNKAQGDEMETLSVPLPMAPGVFSVIEGLVGGPSDPMPMVMNMNLANGPGGPMPSQPGVMMNMNGNALAGAFSQQLSIQPMGNASIEPRPAAVPEEVEDDEEWQIKEADPNATQPAWAKRKHSDEADDQELPAKKKRKIKKKNPRKSKVSSAATTTPDPQPEGEMHIVDKVMHDIAKEFRFTVGEVQEFYDKCGDAERTRARFKKMRETLEALEQN